MLYVCMYVVCVSQTIFLLNIPSFSMNESCRLSDILISSYFSHFDSDGYSFIFAICHYVAKNKHNSLHCLLYRREGLVWEDRWQLMAWHPGSIRGKEKCWHVCRAEKPGSDLLCQYIPSTLVPQWNYQERLVQGTVWLLFSESLKSCFIQLYMCVIIILINLI